MVVEPITCPHAASCGGCDLLGVPYPEQLARKEARMAAALAPYRAVVTAEVRPARAADPTVRYRARLKWMAGPGGALGLFGRGGHQVVDTPECQVAEPVLAAVADTLRGLLREPAHARVAASLRAVDLRSIHAAGSLAVEGSSLIVERSSPAVESSSLAADGSSLAVDHSSPAIEAAPGTCEALVTLVLVREERPPRKDLEAFAAALRAAQPAVLGVSANWVAKRSIQVLGPETELVAGAASALDRQGEVAVTASPGAFVQAHRRQAAAMAAEIVGRLGAPNPRSDGSAPRVLELFAGAAPFGLALARAGCAVTAVEAFGPAVEGALAAARAQGLTLTAITGDAEVEAERLARSGARFDVVVVDPPRRGLGPRLRRAIAALAPRAVAYVSCDPSTLARDLADLAWHGLAARAVTPWDFVPLTEHVEGLAWLEPAAPPPLRIVGRHEHALGVDAPPHVDLAALSARAARESGALPGRGGRPVIASPLPRGASGVVVVAADGAPRPRLGRARVVAAVRGAPRGSLRGVPGVLTVLARAASRSLVAIELEDARDLERLADRLGSAGHPVLGDPRDAATARHVLEKHGVDRPLLHVEALALEGGATWVAPLAPDLRAALDSLGLIPTGAPRTALPDGAP